MTAARTALIGLSLLAALPLLVLGWLALSWLLTADCGGREVPPEQTCRQSLVFLGEVLLRYKAEHGSFPPSVFPDRSGNNASWRVVLSPSLISMGYRHLSENEREEAANGLKGYRFDEPWDSKRNALWAENNRGLDLLWNEFFCPTETEYDADIGLLPNAARDIQQGKNPFAAHYISYLMLVRPDPHAALPDDAVIVVETLGCGVRVQDPRDLALDELLKAKSPFGVGRLNSVHPRVVKALRADGKVIDIPKDISKENLRKLLEGTSRKREGSGT
jgi:hypothetical protein